MKEFYWWVLIVTFLLAILGFSIASALFSYNQVRKAEAILQRAEQLEKKNRPKLEPKSDKEE